MKRAIWNIISSTAPSEGATIGGAAVTIRVDARARRMRLRVDPRTRGVTLTVPRRVSRRRALAWAAGQRAWIEQALAGIPEALPFAPGGTVPLEGVPHRIAWEPARPRRIERG